MTLEFKPSWRPIDRPVGPQPLPEWCGGANVEMRADLGSFPRVVLKETGPLPEFHAWQRDALHHAPKVRWFRTSVDGSLMEQFWHAGKMRQLEDGSWQTEKQEGFGGRVFTIEPVVGWDRVHLVGPWHGGKIDGWMDAHTVNMREPKAYDAGLPWHKRMACFGLCVSEAAYIAILSRFVPHMELARVKHFHDWPEFIEPYPVDWGMPKWFYQRREEVVDGC